MAESSFTLAKVKDSNEQDYLRFAYIVLYMVAVVVVIGWGHYQGYVELMLNGMGKEFTAFFGVLMVITMVIGAYQGFRCSRAINGVKRIANDRKALMHSFGLDNYGGDSFDYVCRQVDLFRSKSLRGLVFTYEVALLAGFFGTLVGMLVATGPLGALTVFNQDTLGPQMPTFFVGIALAVWSAVAGIVVALVAAGFVTLIENSNDVFTQRVDRAFHNISKD